MYIYNHVRTYIPKHNTQNPKICIPKPNIHTQNPKVFIPKPNTHTQTSKYFIPKPNIHTQNPKVFWVKRLVCDDKYAIGIHRNSDKVTEYQVRV